MSGLVILPPNASIVTKEIHDEHTIAKVRFALKSHGLSMEQADNAMVSMMNAGIVFREVRTSVEWDAPKPKKQRWRPWMTYAVVTVLSMAWWAFWLYWEFKG